MKPLTNELPRSSFGVWLAIVVILLFATYVVSVGPAMWLVKQQYIAEHSMHWFYEPLIFVCRILPPLKPLLDWYVVWWFKLPPDPP
jgi:hypothetical protein